MVKWRRILKTAAVLGSAACVFNDLESARSRFPIDGVVACNGAITEYHGTLDAAVSVHSDKLKNVWLPKRKSIGLPAPERSFGWFDGTNEKLFVNGIEKSDWHLCKHRKTSWGSSGLFAVKIALVDLGFDRVILCGMPMSDEKHIDTGLWFEECGVYRDGWRDVSADIYGKVKSESGWTRDLLGPPEEWLNGDI